MEFFESRSARVEFVVLEEEMGRVADLIRLTERTVRVQLSEARDTLRRLERREERVIDPDEGDVTDEVIIGMLDVDIPHAEWIATTLSNGAHHLLVFAMLERCLRFLCDSFGDGAATIARKSGASTIDRYLAHLRETLGFEFEPPDDFSVVREDARRMRNAFAHGDWDSEAVRSSAIPATRLLQIVSQLFRNLEDACYPVAGES